MKGLDQNNKLTFGKYRGKVIKIIITMFPKYVKWAVNKGLLELPPYLKL